MADEKFELNEEELTGASGGVVTDEDRGCVTYTCPNCGGIIKWKKFPKKNAPHVDEEWACDNCYTFLGITRSAGFPTSSRSRSSAPAVAATR